MIWEQLIITVVWIHLLALILPWPDLIMIIKNSLSSSKKTGVFMALWSSLWVLFHISYSLLWLGIILSKALLLFWLIKILWAMYLIYFWLNLFISNLELEKKLEEDKIITQKEISFLEAIKIWFLTNILNPKVILFFLSLFSLLINEKQESFVILTSSTIIILNNFLWFSLIALIMSNKKIRMIYEKIQVKLNKFFWTILIVFWIKFLSITK
jgi:threonine/homoserine/homoserine lactone efflux protein